MTLCCGCDMPIEVYADWCQDQGWDAEELRADEQVVLYYAQYIDGNGMEEWYESRGSGRSYVFAHGYSTLYWAHHLGDGMDYGGFGYLYETGDAR